MYLLDLLGDPLIPPPPNTKHVAGLVASFISRQDEVAGGFDDLDFALSALPCLAPADHAELKGESIRKNNGIDFVQRAGIETLSKTGDAHVGGMRATYDKRRKLMVELMREVGFS